MKHLLRVLTVHSGRDLMRYKSFFLLIFSLILFDRAVHQWIPTQRPGFHRQSLSDFGELAAVYVFERFPEQILAWLWDSRVMGVIVGLFLLKQIISLWPSSDMRRMHRREREQFGLLTALTAIRWHQILWDAIAVSAICGIVGTLSLTAFFFTRFGWQQHHQTIWLVLFAVCLSLCAPPAMAGFSYSSKLAVISRGRFGEKLRLFFLLFTDWRIFWTSWIFFSARIVAEFLFVAAIPIGAILYIDHFWLRMPIAAVSATPVYAFLKMASFKFFLYTYSPFALVREEYRDYFRGS